MLNALKQVFYDPPFEPCDCEPQTDLLDPFNQTDNVPRRTSGASSVSGNTNQIASSSEVFMTDFRLIFQSAFFPVSSVESLLSFVAFGIGNACGMRSDGCEWNNYED